VAVEVVVEEEGVVAVAEVVEEVEVVLSNVEAIILVCKNAIELRR
jgi:hypothetical protein